MPEFQTAPPIVQSPKVYVGLRFPGGGEEIELFGELPGGIHGLIELKNKSATNSMNWNQ